MNTTLGRHTDFRTELLHYLGADPARGKRPRLSIRRESCSDAVIRLRDEPEDQLARELELTPHRKPEVLAIAGSRHVGPTGAEIRLRLTEPPPDGWDFALMQALDELRAGETLPPHFQAFVADEELHVRGFDVDSAEDTYRAVTTLLEETQSRHEARQRRSTSIWRTAVDVLSSSNRNYSVTIRPAAFWRSRPPGTGATGPSFRRTDRASKRCRGLRRW
jgi:hypothetical protein